MKVLLIGGTGRLSRDTTELCINKGYDVYLINRGHRNTFDAPNVHYLIGDINDRDGILRALGDEEFDVVVDYLTYNITALIPKLELFQNRTKQFVFISSATVFPAGDGVISEAAPIGNDGWSYARKKRICEEYIRENADSFSFQNTIVRPYVTYDRRRIPFPVISKKSGWNLLDRISKDLPILMPDDGEQKETLTSSIDFAVGVTGLFLNPKAYGEDFNITGDTVATWNEVLAGIEQALNKKAHVVYAGADRLAKDIPSLSQELLFDKACPHVFDNSKLKDAVPEFQTTIDIAHGMAMTVNYLLNHKEEHVADEPWNIMEDVLCHRYGYKGMSVGFARKWSYFKMTNPLLKKIRRRKS